jgi:hypothetical protein
MKWPREMGVSMRVYRVLCAAAVFAVLTTAMAQADTANTKSLASGAASPPATLADVAWIKGHWRGPGIGGQAEEIWSAPDGGAMMCAFRVLKDGKVWFYEISLIAEDKGSLVLRVKHFNADLTGWEEKAEVQNFALVKIEKDAVYFDGITFRKSADGGMDVYVSIHHRDNSVTEGHFDYARVAD